MSLSLLVLAGKLAEAKFQYAGVSLSCAEFGNAIPGVYDKDYTYPTHAEVDYFSSKGLNTLRLPFRWERLQQKLRGDFDSFNLGKITDLVQYATGKGIYILLDPHNYARYNNEIIGASGVSAADFADFWGRLSSLFKNNDHVIFGLMNEPNTMKTETWLDDANAAIAAIRGTGARNVIFVPGNAWTGAGSWYDNWYGTANSEVMKNIKDAFNNSVFEVHNYLDSDGSGTSPTCVSDAIGASKLEKFTSWCEQYGFKAFLGEFAGGANSVCQAGIKNMLQYMDKNNHIWTGFTWWAAGPWWGDYMYSIEPKNGQDAPQLPWVQGWI